MILRGVKILSLVLSVFLLATNAKSEGFTVPTIPSTVGGATIPSNCDSGEYAIGIDSFGAIVCSTIDDAIIGGDTPSESTFTNVTIKNGSNTILNALNTDPNSYSGDLVQVQLSSNGGSTVTGSSDAYRLIRGDITLTAGTQSGVFTVAHFQAQTSGSSSSTGTGGSGIRGLIASAIHNSTGTVAAIVGLNSNAAVGTSGGSITAGNVTDLQGNRVTTGYVSGFNGTGVIANNYGVIVVSPQNTSSGSSRLITNFYGLYVDDTQQSGVTNGYSIYTGTGRVRLGGNLEFGTGTATDSTLFTIARNADSPNALEYAVPSARIHKFTVAGTTEMTLSATAVDFQNNSLTTTGGGSLTGTWTNLGTVSTIDINGGTLDGVIIGGAAPASATVTSLSMAQLITWTGGQAITAGNYQCGRDADATNQFHCNVPTGATYELSINDVPAAVLSSSALNLPRLLQFSPQVVTVPDDGAGTPALITITPSSGDIQITCNDTNGCNVTMSETGAKNGASIHLVNMSANSCMFADTGGVSELAGTFTAGQYDTISMTYQSDRWVEDSRSNN